MVTRSPAADCHVPSLVDLGGTYLVSDGNHRVSVARFHGVEWIDAEVTQSGSPSARAA